MNGRSINILAFKQDSTSVEENEKNGKKNLWKTANEITLTHNNRPEFLLLKLLSIHKTHIIAHSHITNHKQGKTLQTKKNYFLFCLDA